MDYEQKVKQKEEQKEEQKEMRKVGKKKKKRNWWKLVVFDVTLYLIGMGIFLLFDYVLPQKGGEGMVVSSKEGISSTFTLPSEETLIDTKEEESEEDAVIKESENAESTNESTNEDTTDTSKKSASRNNRGRGDTSSDSNDFGTSNGSERGNTNTIEINASASDIDTINHADVAEELLETYQDENAYLTITKKEIGSDADKITYYVADVYVSSLTSLQTAFAQSTYGKNIKDNLVDIADDNRAILAISGDSYGVNEDGIVIRNGVLYRSDSNDADVCVLFTDGTMKTYTADEFDANEVIAAGAWQAWSFGPELLDGEGAVLSSFHSTSYLSGAHPRSAIGYIEPGHYVLVVVDGRQTGYSKGATLSELAQIMVEEGCISAYNLDGGNSIGMIYNGAYVNQPEKTREISDIIYVN